MTTPIHASVVSSANQVPLSVVDRFIVAHLVDNFDASDLDSLESRLLNRLCENRSLRGVIFNFNEVITTDPLDLERLQAIFVAIRLVGGRVGLCGINPGLAMVIVSAGLNFQREHIGIDLDALLPSL